ncbi:MAG: hypothetical protein NC241_07665 [Bacteroides sp.]|nr:hypothetical protein [Bacteroides sp.]MCM1456453.1 hypothetical protein [Lachnoclostridium sp.]
MKKLYILLYIAIIAIACSAQTYKLYPTKNYHNQLRLNTATGKIEQLQDDGLSWTICTGIEISTNKSGRFSLTETQNMWTFIMLDTYTGKNWQVQFSVKGEDYMFASPINKYPLAYPTSESNWVDRFQLFPTQNMWNLILLDSYTGRLWQVQYSTKDFESQICIPINDIELSKNNQSVFTIKPMTSMYQYFLINSNTGDTWKFQWSTKGDDYRWIERYK